MPLAQTVNAFLTDEWARFVKGVRLLDPEAADAQLRAEPWNAARNDRARTINIPGWDDVIKIPNAPRATRAERAEVRAASLEGRTVNLDAGRASIASAEVQRAADRRQSAQPESTRGWTSILTALDNVQDMVSTIGTLGRLAIWSAPRVPGLLAPFAPALAARLSAAGLSLGLRFVPAVGWVLLASDLLNLLGLLGMGASPVYALLCQGTSAAQAAGAPTLLFKRGLKQEVWKRATTNPFGREARAAFRTKAMSGRIGVANLIEVFQTTEQLWGWGLSFGAIMGAVTEATAAITNPSQGAGYSIRTPTLVTPQAQVIADRLAGMTPVERAVTQQAAAVMATAPAIARVQAHFTDEQHLTAMLALAGSVGVIRDLWRGLDADQIIADFADIEARPPMLLSDVAREDLASVGLDPNDGRQWWLDGHPDTATYGAVMDDAISRVPGAVREFLAPRRNSAEATLFGTLVSQLTEHLWLATTGDNEALRWRLAPDYALLASLSESGWLVSFTAPEPALMRFWNRARALLAERGHANWDETEWQSLAQKAGVPLIRMLSPLTPFPGIWATPDPGAEV